MKKLLMMGLMVINSINMFAATTDFNYPIEVHFKSAIDTAAKATLSTVQDLKDFVASSTVLNVTKENREIMLFISTPTTKEEQEKNPDILYTPHSMKKVDGSDVDDTTLLSDVDWPTKDNWIVSVMLKYAPSPTSMLHRLHH